MKNQYKIRNVAERKMSHLIIITLSLEPEKNCICGLKKKKKRIRLKPKCNEKFINVGFKQVMDKMWFIL